MSDINRRLDDYQGRHELYRQVQGEVVARNSPAAMDGYAVRHRMNTVWDLVEIAAERIPELDALIAARTPPGSGAEYACRRILAIAGLTAEDIIRRYGR